MGGVVRAVRDAYPDLDLLVLEDGSSDHASADVPATGATVLVLRVRTAGTGK